MPQLAVAASGGADSIILLLEAARKFPPDQVTVLSVDHRTRASAAAERSHVASVAAALGFAFQELCIGSVRPNQAAWRQARLDALLRFCRSNKIKTLWLGHHRDDAVETAALRLLAGGTLASLAGISAARVEAGVRIERPLLNLTSREVRRRLMAAGVGWYEDPSNRDVRYRRVAVRHVLASDGGEDKSSPLVRRTAYWRAVREQTETDAWRLAFKVGVAGSLTLDPYILQNLPEDLAVALLRRAALMAAGREQRLRRADFAGALACGVPPWQLGGVRVWAHQAQWLVGRDYRHVRDVVSLTAAGMATWDARYHLVLPDCLPPGDWRAARLGLAAARRLGLELPPDWAAAALAIWNGGRLAAVPEFNQWIGESGTFWAKKLTWNRLADADTGLFRVAP